MLGRDEQKKLFSPTFTFILIDQCAEVFMSGLKKTVPCKTSETFRITYRLLTFSQKLEKLLEPVEG